MKKVFIWTALVLAVLVPAAAFAAEFNSPSDLLAALTGKSAAEIAAQRAQGKTNGQIAQDNGVLHQFEEKMLELKKAIIDKRVADGVLTAEKAEAIKEALIERQANCDGTPGSDREGIGQKFGGGLAFGRGLDGQSGQGNGQGQSRMGQGMRGGIGRGQGFSLSK